jgi:hypothetical protein
MNITLIQDKDLFNYIKGMVRMKGMKGIQK